MQVTEQNSTASFDDKRQKTDKWLLRSREIFEIADVE